MANAPIDELMVDWYPMHCFIPQCKEKITRADEMDDGEGCFLASTLRL